MSPYRWYLSVAAVREYAALAGLPLDDGGPLWTAAEQELAGHCDAARETEGSTHSGAKIWRTGNRQGGGRNLGRIELTVSVSRRAEGDLPQLLRVRLKSKGVSATRRHNEMD